jgi:16S rRNA C967 or C1407 C5-methylase (RsmB/RsmF family)
MPAARSVHRSHPVNVALPGAWVDALYRAQPAEAAPLIKALHAEVPTSIRSNPLKPHHHDGHPVSWCAQGRYLTERPVFTLDPLFHAGCYYVQEASSMFLEQAVRATGLDQGPVLALDLCAAPGGKSTHLLALLDPGSLLVSNEMIRSRQAALIENLWKWGAPNCVITGSPPVAFSTIGPLFDLGRHRCPVFRRRHVPKGSFRASAMEPRAGGPVHHAPA